MARGPNGVIDADARDEDRCRHQQRDQPAGLSSSAELWTRRRVPRHSVPSPRAVRGDGADPLPAIPIKEPVRAQLTRHRDIVPRMRTRVTLVLVLLLTACGSASTAAGTSPAASASPAGSPTVSPSPVASLPCDMHAEVGVDQGGYRGLLGTITLPAG